MLRLVGPWCIGVLGAVSLLGCGAEHFEPHAEPTPRGELAGQASRHEADAMPPTALGEGRLEVATRSNVTSFLGSTEAVVEDAEGNVVAGAFEDAGAAGSNDLAPLTFSLPAGQEYTLRLTSTTQDASPTTCRATVGPVRVEDGAAAHVRVFAWDCGERMGYVPQAAQDDCYWLADWSFVAQTRAGLGEAVEVAVATGAEAPELRFHWSSLTPEAVAFSDAEAPTTALRCVAPGDELAFEVSIDDGTCRQHVNHAISCR
jgi:hypothetical protein